MLVRDAMVQPIETVAPDTPLQSVARRLKDKDIGCLTVAEDGKAVGIITDRDVACRGVAVSDNLAEFKARDVMTSTVFCCSEGQSLTEAVSLMMEQRVYHLPVIDRDERLVGMLALGDVALKAPAQMSPPLRSLMARDAARHHAESDGGRRRHTKAASRS